MAPGCMDGRPGHDDELPHQKPNGRTILHVDSSNNATCHYLPTERPAAYGVPLVLVVSDVDA